MLIAVIAVLCWLVCGALSYGLRKDCFRLLFSAQKHDGKITKEELALIHEDCLTRVLWGPLLLPFTALDNINLRRDMRSPGSWIGICYKMPADLCDDVQ